MFVGMVGPARKINRRPGNTDERKPFLWDKMSHVTCHGLVSFISLLSVKNVVSDFCAIIPSWLAKVPVFDTEPRSLPYIMSLAFIYVCRDSCHYAVNPGHCYLSTLSTQPMNVHRSIDIIA